MTTHKTHPELAEYKLIVPWPVQWGDQDAFGHVNNTVYFRWYETARIIYGHKIGLDAMFERERIGPILASITGHYRRQLTYPDTVLIGARISKLGRTSMTMDHKLVSERQQALVADGTSTIVVFDYTTQKPTPISDSLRAAIEKLEGRAF